MLPSAVTHGWRGRSAVPVLLAPLLLLLLCAPLAQGVARTSAAAEACPPATRSGRVKLPPASAPRARPRPRRILACVGSRAVTGATFDQWLKIAKKAAQGNGTTLTPGEAVDEVMGFLLSAYWVIGEAHDRGIHVSAREVRRTFKRIRDEEFPKPGEFQKYLGRSGETVADLLFRVETNLYSQRIQKRVTAGHRTEQSRQRALTKFVKAFRRKWRPRTYCLPDYAVADCGHVHTAPL
jgi:hypothetical protein